MERIRANGRRSSKTLYAIDRSRLIFEGHQARFLCDNCAALIISVCGCTDQRVGNTTIQAKNAPSEVPTASVASGWTLYVSSRADGHCLFLRKGSGSCMIDTFHRNRRIIRGRDAPLAFPQRRE
jgi:hypothetical protein